MASQPCKGHPSISAAIRAVLVISPNADVREIAAELDLDDDVVFNILRGFSVATKGPSQERIQRLLPMLHGPGDRHEDCRRYEDCLTRAAIEGGHAHCPEVCPSYQAIPADYYRTLALIPRETSTGVNVHLRTVGRGTW